jgi:prolyl-tRNA synthetase
VIVNTASMYRSGFRACPVISKLTRSKTCVRSHNYVLRRHVQHDSRTRYTNFWIPPRHYNSSQSSNPDVDSNQLLVAAGFLRQAYSGIFHLLPLGVRVQDKLERLIDKHMRSLGASKVSLSSVTSQDLWERSGRFAANPDLFKFRDRRDGKWLLSPTHEEEITALIGSLVQFQRDMPVRLYQVSRKYRDEPRPRQGLLRGKEFLMKDLYTFDIDTANALSTYEEVKKAYHNLFDELKLPYLVAKADSGNMGGSLSHEFHFPSAKGEDDVISCSHCDYVKNEELVDAIKLKSVDVSTQCASSFPTLDASFRPPTEFVAMSDDKHHLIKAYVPQREDSDQSITRKSEINRYIIKASVPDARLGYEEPAALWEQHWAESSSSADQPSHLPTIRYLFDHKMSREDIQRQIGSDYRRYSSIFKYQIHVMVPSDLGQELNLVRTASGDKCPQCEEGQLLVQKAIEVGHTFHLGDRYSKKLGAEIESKDVTGASEPMQMGCHGIGVSRLIAAVASALADDSGLNWPRAIAPFQVVIIPQKPSLTEDAARLYDKITSACPDVDIIIDDRPKRDLPHKLFEADAIGFPVILVLGKGWKEGKVEVQCRRLGRTKNDPHVLVEDLPTVINMLLGQL